MLSERHNANAIYYWLAEWTRMGAKIPNEVVMDDSAALISATCRAFGKENSIAVYVNKAFGYLKGDDNKKPNCLIRIDVAHLTNLIRKWPEITSLRAKTKEFFIRCILFIAKANSIEEVEEILNSIIIVALSETEGKSYSTGEETPCEMRKSYLLKRIAGIVVQEEEIQEATKEDQDLLEHIEVIEDKFVKRYNDCALIRRWWEKLKNNAESAVTDDGDRDNIMYAPQLIKKLKNLLFLLPLWCRALSLKMKSPYPTSVGAYVETEIGLLKKISSKIRKE